MNVVAASLHGRADLTEDKRYSLTQNTRELTRNLQNNVNIDVFLKGEFPSGFRKLSTSTQEFLSVLKETNPGRINYRFISRKKKPAMAKPGATPYGQWALSPLT
jgi:ABC-2 type transport system permease protein